MSTAIFPPIFSDHFYTQSFTHTVDQIKSVYYATAEMNARTYGPNYPLNPALKFIWYEIDASNYSCTHLTTRISGYFQYPDIS